jgi:ABC-2 type transport system permease protein
MTGMLALCWVDLKLSLRNVLATFFTLVFPVLLMLLFGAMYGNRPEALLGGYGAMDLAVPGYIVAMVIGSASFMGLPIELVSRRQSGVLRRFKASPLSAAAVLGSQLLVHLLVVSLGSCLLLVTGSLAWGLHPPPSVLLLVPAFLLCFASQFSLGLLLASRLRSVKAAVAISMAVYYPMLFLCGGTIPLGLMPRAIQDVSRFLPMTWAVALLRDLWLGKEWNMTALGVTGAVMLVALSLALRLFRWE